MKRRQLTLLAAVLVAAGIGGSAFAGTPNLTGYYVGTFNLTVRDEGGTIRGTDATARGWTFDFDNKLAKFEDGNISGVGGSASYSARTHITDSEWLPLEDHGDGKYTVTYKFAVNHASLGVKIAATSSTFDITKSGSNLTITTEDAEFFYRDPSTSLLSPTDGVVGTRIVFTSPLLPLDGAFPYAAQRDRSGTATLVP